MAKIYPNVEVNFNNSYGEWKIFESLKKLPDDWYVFHSVKWSEKRNFGNVTWGEADFVIFNALYGILVLEVKSGIISCKDGVFRQKRLDNGKEFNITPFEQADRSKYKIIGELKKKNIADSCFVDKAVWFPSVDDDFDDVDLPLNYKKELILTARDLDSPVESLTRVFEYYNAQKFTDLYNDDIDKVFQILIPQFDLVPKIGVERDELEYQLDQLTEEQKRILDFIGEEDDVVITGTAGTGKTFVALERARRLARDNKKVLYLCYNRQLRDYLYDNNEEPNIAFLNIHQFLYLKGLLSSLNEEEISIAGEIDFSDSDYNYLIIDEAQDFGNEVLKELVDAAKRQNIKITLFYDKNQLVIKNKLPEIISDFDCKMTLRNNCRNTIKIIETLSNSIKMLPNPSHLSAQGTMPNLYYADSSEKIIAGIEKIIDQYVSDGYSLEDITILTVGSLEKSILVGKNNVGKYAISDERGKDVILFTTVRKFKGLESDCVVIIDYDLDRIDDEEYARLFYVASSRARQKLDIFTEANFEKINNVGGKIDGSFSPVMKLSNRMKVKIEEIV